MDPDAAYARWKSAVRDQDWIEAQEAHEDLENWLRRGGFEPRWTEKQQHAFMVWHNPRHRKHPRSAENPLSSGTTIALVAGGVAAVGLIGYFIYKASQTASTAANAALQSYNAPSTIPGSVTAPSNVLQPTPGVTDQVPPFVSGT